MTATAGWTAEPLGKPEAAPDLGGAEATNLARSAVRGGAVTLAAQGIKVVVQLVSITALSRLLDPRDFGLIAMAAAVVGFVELFKDLGLSLATVQAPRITQEQLSALFWINAAAGLGLAIVTASCAPLVAWCYGEPRLTAITMASALGLAVGGLAVQHQALIRRRMAFGALAMIDVASMALAVVVAVAVACAGGGYWALVAQPLVSAIVTSSGVFLLGNWRPSRSFRWSEARRLVGFGADMAGCNVLSYLSKTLDNVLIGRRWGASQLGIYSRAYGILMLPITQINGPIAAVAIPVLSRLSGDRKAFSRQYLKLVRVLLSLTTPACFAMAIFSDEIVRVLLGRGWFEAGRILRVLSVASLVLPVLYAGGWLYAATGRTRLYLFVWIAHASGLFTAFLVGLPGGASGVARAYAVAMWVMIGPFLAMAVRGTGIGAARLLGTIAAPFFACLAGAALVVRVDASLAGSAGPLVRLLIGCPILATSSLLALFASFRLPFAMFARRSQT